MILYSGPMSLFTGKVRIALDEKGLDYELVSVPFSRAGYEPKHPKVLELNPKRQVPVLVDGELAIYDSTIIFEYLEERHPEPALYPRDPARKARCRVMEAAADEILFPSVWDLIRELFYKPDGTGRDESVVANAKLAITAHYDRLERQLGEQSFLCGEVSVADIGYFMTITFATSLGQGLTDAHPGLQAWYGRALARPAFQRELERLMTANRSLASGVS
jgi:glutathione S-transferase